MMHRNYILGRPPVFGDKEQIRAVKDFENGDAVRVIELGEEMYEIEVMCPRCRKFSCHSVDYMDDDDDDSANSIGFCPCGVLIEGFQIEDSVLLEIKFSRYDL